ncbi:hypothetical protein AVEN_148825-1 [Araneus ventricosus]|uniref:Uncharacterized protein n=1 Tax=Araneus ventricosus TaxID=182803 RepID=A0A4Y2WLA3_ARAVE|nr:hypothetical protein AVEN_148825-1 [Araneus ventricosus]
MIIVVDREFGFPTLLVFHLAIKEIRSFEASYKSPVCDWERWGRGICESQTGEIRAGRVLSPKSESPSCGGRGSKLPIVHFGASMNDPP